ncbi:MAG TPA: type II secretion system F family protein [Paracoccaceae bacterium]|nr:type II secretion system F family protein [Paracoccaceae bacterium]
MDFIANLEKTLTDAMGPAGPLVAVGMLGFMLILATLPMMLRKRPEPFDKLKLQSRPAETPAGERLRMGGGNKKVDKLEKFAGFLEPQSAEEMSASRLRMLRAGYRSKNAVRIYHFSQLCLGLGLLALGTIYALIVSQSGQMTSQQMVMYTILPGALGYYAPVYYINKRIKERETQITQGFPDALDMMLVCVEAGQSLDQSIMRVAKESRAGYPALAEEFEIVSHEVKAGKERVAVLKDMSERVGIADVTSFVTTLVQSATFGTSIAEALRVYSAEMRDKRVMRAEEKANTLPTKLTLGTMMFTVPPLMIILIGPSIHGIATHMGGKGG